MRVGTCKRIKGGNKLCNIPGVGPRITGKWDGRKTVTGRGRGRRRRRRSTGRLGGGGTRGKRCKTYQRVRVKGGGTQRRCKKYR